MQHRLILPLVTLSLAGLLACGGSGTGSTQTSSTSTDTDTGTDSGSSSDSSSSWNLSTGANSADVISNTSFAYTVTLDLDTLAVSSSSSALSVSTVDGTSTLTLSGSTVITVAPDDYGLTITSDMPEGTYVAFKLTGGASAAYEGTITLYSGETCELILDGAHIASTDGPALNIQSDERTFVVLENANTLTDSSTWSTRYLSDGSTEMDLKATFFSEGPLLFNGTGSLSITAAKKHALCSDGHVRLTEGTLSLTANKKDGIRTNDAFIMDDGTLSITTASGAGKGIKVEGRESDEPLGFVIINDGTLTISSYDKAITAAWETDEDATTTDTADDPDPFVTINGGTLTIATTGTAYEDTDTSDGDDSLSPEGIEAKSTLTINGGTLEVTTDDDALNAGTALNIAGGTIYAKSTSNDAVDSNGSMTLSGGTLVAIGAGSPEGGLDDDEGTNFTISGGTFIGLGGANSTPHTCTQYTLNLSALSAGLMAIKDSSGNLVFAFTVPSSGTALCGSPDFGTGNYTLATGGSLSGATSSFHGLYQGLSSASLSGSTSSQSFTISSTYTSVGSSTR
nr:carbohydrate-binding domain-containing protein [uncultured Holophaga sp.]